MRFLSTVIGRLAWILGTPLDRHYDGANTQIIDGLLKDYFQDHISEQINNANPWSDIYKFVEEGFGGRETIYAAHVSRNTSPMFTGEDGAFAVAGAQGHVDVRVGQKKLMGRIRLTPESMLDTSRGEYAWTQARKSETDGLIEDLARRAEYALTLDGRGVLARVDDASPSGAATLGVDAPGGITNDNFGNRFIMVKMFVGFVDPATGVLRAGIRKVLSVSADGSSIVLDSAPDATVADDDYIVQAANSSVTDITDTSFEQAYWGVVAHIDDGTYRTNYFGIDRDIYDSYNSYVSPSTGPLSVDVMQQSADVVDQKLNGRTNLLAMHHAIRRVYINILATDRRYIGASLQRPDGGTAAFKQDDLTMGEVPIKAVRDLPLDMVFGLDTKGMGAVRYVSEKGKWVDEDGRVLVRAGVGDTARDAFEAWYRQRMQYHVEYPGKCWRLDGITGQTIIIVRPAGD
jgi:hypothetical protein